MKKRVFLFLLAAAFAALACGVAAAAPKDEIVVGTASDAKSLDPQMANDTSSSCALIQMYEFTDVRVIQPLKRFSYAVRHTVIKVRDALPSMLIVLI